jgi:hypothetical protein
VCGGAEIVKRNGADVDVVGVNSEFMRTSLVTLALVSSQLQRGAAVCVAFIHAERRESNKHRRRQIKESIPILVGWLTYE